MRSISIFSLRSSQAQTQPCEMADWSTRYLAALDARDRRESTHKSYIDACMFSLSDPPRSSF